MPEMNALFQEMIGTLQEASEAMGQELRLLPVQSSDRTSLARLLDAAGTFAGQSESLAVMMIERDAEDLLLGMAQDLAAFFRNTEERVQAMLEAGRG